MTEAQFQSKVIKFLQEQGIWFIKYWGGGRYTRAGVPDLLCCIDGLFVAIELKTNYGRVSKLQAYTIEQINSSGGIGIVLRPKQFKAFKQWIKEVKEWQKRNQTVGQVPSFPTQE